MPTKILKSLVFFDANGKDFQAKPLHLAKYSKKLLTDNFSPYNTKSKMQPKILANFCATPPKKYCTKDKIFAFLPPLDIQRDFILLYTKSVYRKLCTPCTHTLGESYH